MAVDRKVIVIEHIHGPITDVVTRHQPTHAVRDQIDLEISVTVVSADLLDKSVQRTDRLDIVAAPVVGEYVVVFRAGRDRLAGATALIPARLGQHTHDLAVKIPARRPISDTADAQVARQWRQGRGIDVQGQVVIIVEQQTPGRTWPGLASAGRILEPAAEDAVDQYDRRLLGICLTSVQTGQVRARRRTPGQQNDDEAPADSKHGRTPDWRSRNDNTGAAGL